MVKIIYEGKSEYADKNKIYYEIADGIFKITMETYSSADKESLFNREENTTEVSYVLDKNNTEKLLKLLSEEEIKNKFGNDDGFYDFSEFCDKNKIEIEYVASLR